MCKPALAVIASLLLTATAAHAQDAKFKSAATPEDAYTFTQMTPTPEMWMYSQQQKLLSDPVYCVKQNAMREAALRKQRMEARAWYGVSLSRPTAGITSAMNQTQQMWGSNTRDPLIWAPTSVSPIYIAPSVRTVSTSYGLW